MDFRQKYHELVGLPQAIRIDFVDEREKHRCSYCKTRQYTGCFRCPSCVRKKIDENKDAVQVLDVQRQEKEARIAAYVESVKGTYLRQKKTNGVRPQNQALGAFARICTKTTERTQKRRGAFERAAGPHFNAPEDPRRHSQRVPAKMGERQSESSPSQPENFELTEGS